MNRFKFVIPTMIVVFLLAMWLLGKDYSMVPIHIRILIAVGGSLLSGVLSYFLMQHEGSSKDKNHNK